MQLTSVKEIKDLLSKYDTAPTKYMGQNFLIDASVLNKIIATADLSPNDTVLEIGPGLGILTKALAENVKKVITIEKDRAMVEILKETIGNFKNVEILTQDILKFADYSLLTKNYKLVANVPYYITSPIIRMFLEAENQPEFMVLMVQKEVAQRICAKPNDMSLLAVSVQFYAKPEIISYISKECFWPAPKVDSAIIKITPLKDKKEVPSAIFFEIVKAGFSHKRKQLVNNLCILKSKNGVTLDKYKVTQWLLENNLKPNQRAETLSIEDWVSLTLNYKMLT